MSIKIASKTQGDVLLDSRPLKHKNKQSVSIGQDMGVWVGSPSALRTAKAVSGHKQRECFNRTGQERVGLALL